MRNPRSLADREKDRAKSKAELMQRVARAAKKSHAPEVVAPSASEQKSPARPSARPADFVSAPRATSAFPALLRSRAGEAVALQPWTRELAATLLDRASDAGVSLCLLWPAEIEGIARLHAVASLSRVVSTRFGGLRTMLYPGTQVSQIALDQFSTPRGPLRDLWRETFERAPLGPNVPFQAVLHACNEIENDNPTVAPPTLRHLLPTFIYDPSAKQWVTSVEPPVERLLTKVARRAMTEQHRKNVFPSWTNAAEAPGALLVLPRALKRQEMKAAFSSRVGHSRVDPDVLLLDASTHAGLQDPASVRRIPDLLKAANEARRAPTGALIVTDDPTEFFVLRSRLQAAGVECDARVIVAEAERLDVFAAANVLEDSWKAPVRAPVNITIAIVDEVAARLACRFGNIAKEVQSEGAAVEEPFRQAQAFVMRSSHLPGGFVDLRAAEDEERLYISRGLEWERIETLIRTNLTVGNASSQRRHITDALARVHKLVADCEHHTPLALRLLAEVKRHAIVGSRTMSLILPSRRHVAIAQRYLSRVLDSDWSAVAQRLTWYTASDAPDMLSARSREERLVIVGLSSRLVRLLATSAEIPTGTTFLVPVQKALGVTRTLEGMVAAEALKPYRARLSGLLTVLKVELGHLPGVDALQKIADSTPLPPRRVGADSPAGESEAYRFRLEDGRWVVAPGTLFRYESDDRETLFKRVQARSVRVGDCIFDMSDALREEIEEALHRSGEPVELSPARKVLEIYHSQVKSALAKSFAAESRRASAQAVRRRMVELDSSAADISLNKILYWTSLEGSERAPHGARSQVEFALFCRALGLPPDLSVHFWDFICRARSESQIEGRRLNAIYAEILFSPESAQVYRHLSGQTIARLQERALSCVFHVEQIEVPR